MEPALSSACDEFIAQLFEIGIVGRVSTPDDIRKFESSFPRLIPDWYRELLLTKAFADVCFETEVEGLSWGGEGHIRDAETLLSEISGAFPDLGLAAEGYLVIGAAGDGDGWVIRTDSSFSDPVYLLSASNWGGGDPRETEGCLLQHGKSFAEFLSKLNPVSE